MADFTTNRDHFCWAVQTLRTKGEDGRWLKRTPAMAAELADHVWSLKEWLIFRSFNAIRTPPATPWRLRHATHHGLIARRHAGL